MLGYLISGSDGEIVPPDANFDEGWYDTGDIATIDDEGFIFIQGRAKRFAKVGGEMVSLLAVEELAMHAWPDADHAAVSIPDERKGEKIILITTCQDATRKQIQEVGKVLKAGEIAIPRKVLATEELPLLSTGKVDYVTLTAVAIEEDENDTGLIGKLANLVTKSNSEENIENGT